MRVARVGLGLAASVLATWVGWRALASEPASVAGVAAAPVADAPPDRDAAPAALDAPRGGDPAAPVATRTVAGESNAEGPASGAPSDAPVGPDTLTIRGVATFGGACVAEQSLDASLLVRRDNAMRVVFTHGTTLRTDAEGRFERTIERPTQGEQLQLVLHCDEPLSAWHGSRVHVADPDPLDVGVVALEGPERLVRGRVVDPEGRPLPDARVELVTDHEPGSVTAFGPDGRVRPPMRFEPAASDADGVFDVLGFDRSTYRWFVRAGLEGYSGVKAPLPNDAEEAVELVLAPVGSLVGRLELGSPDAPFVLRVEALFLAPDGSATVVDEAYADETGRFAFAGGVPQGDAGALRLAGASALAEDVRLVPLGPDPAEDGVERFALPPDCRVCTVEAFDRDGEPIRRFAVGRMFAGVEPRAAPTQLYVIRGTHWEGAFFRDWTAAGRAELVPPHTTLFHDPLPSARVEVRVVDPTLAGFHPQVVLLDDPVDPDREGKRLSGFGVGEDGLVPVPIPWEGEWRLRVTLTDRIPEPNTIGFGGERRTVDAGVHPLRAGEVTVVEL